MTNKAFNAMHPKSVDCFSGKCIEKQKTRSPFKTYLGLILTALMVGCAGLTTPSYVAPIEVRDATQMVPIIVHFVEERLAPGKTTLWIEPISIDQQTNPLTPRLVSAFREKGYAIASDLQTAPQSVHLRYRISPLLNGFLLRIDVGTVAISRLYSHDTKGTLVPRWPFICKVWIAMKSPFSNTTDHPDLSPDILNQGPKAAQGVGRLNQVPILIVSGIFIVVGLVLVYTLTERSHKLGKAVKEDLGSPVVTSPQVLNGAPTSGVIGTDRVSQDKTQAIRSGLQTFPSSQGVQGTVSAAQTFPTHQMTGNSVVGNPATSAWEAYRAQQAGVDAAHLQAEQSALTNGSEVAISHRQDRLATVAGASLPGIASSNPILNPVTPPANTPDPNGQAAKANFFNQSGSMGNDYLNARRKAPVSPYEVKSGTVIPAVMIGGVNSDLPGQIIAQVREPVYDTATGAYVLIPQGARLIGTYSNAVSMGQTRVLVAWNRIIYPDASSLDLGAMPGVDASGYAGFHDGVNNHYLRIFGTALMMSLFSAGVQLSQPPATNGQNYNSSQIVASSLGLQLGELGMQMAQKGLGIQPTLEIRPGYRFNIMVTKDIILRPWE